MTSPSAVALSRVLFSLLALAAIVVQLVDLAHKGVLHPVNYFSYFTIQSNVIGATVLLSGAVRRRLRRAPTPDLIRGSAVVYLTITFAVFAVLLSGTNVDTALPWVNIVLHKVFPIFVMVDWLISPPVDRLAARQGLAWLIYPLTWTAYTIARGAITNWYPYPFLNPANGGYASVGAYVVAILMFGCVACAGVVMAGNTVRARRRPLPAAK